MGDCHYLKGNYITAKRVAVMKELIGFVGLSPDRLRLEWISGSEGTKFATIMSEFTQQIKELGPSPLGKKA
jgi:coenzyme F420-reducing hydrogenase delta subunit